MADYRKILVLLLEGRSYREVVEIAGCSHRDVARIRQEVQDRGLTSAVAVSDMELAQWFPDGRRKVSEEYDQPDLSRVLASMKQNRHFTLLLAWRRYVDTKDAGKKYGVQPLSLGDLVETLGIQIIRSINGRVAFDQFVSLPVVYDPMDELPGIPGGVLLMAGMSPLSDEVSTALKLAAAQGFCAVVIKGRGADLTLLAQVDSIAVLCVVNEAPWTHVGNLITSLTRNRSIADASTTMAGDLFVLANALATIFDGAAAVEDVDRNVLAYSNLEQHDIDELRRDGILARQVPDLEKHEDQYRRVMLATGVVRFPYDPVDGELPRCAAAVRAGREELGSIWVIEPHGPAGADAEAALLESARLAAIQILQARSSVNLERQVRAEWLRSAFDGSGTDRGTSTRFGVVPNTPSVLAAFLLKETVSPSIEPLVRQLLGIVEQHCSVFRANVSCVSIGPVAYVLFPAVRETGFPLRLARGAAAAAEARLGHVVYGAVGSPNRGAGSLAEMRREVFEILNVVSTIPQLPMVASASDVQAQLLLTHLESELRDKPRLRHPGVSALVEHDTARGTDYRISICAYFGAMGDIGAAARGMNVHPNTLRYRIKRAQALFDLRLDQPDDQLAIWLQLRIAAQPF